MDSDVSAYEAPLAGTGWQRSPGAGGAAAWARSQRTETPRGLPGRPRARRDREIAEDLKGMFRLG